MLASFGFFVSCLGKECPLNLFKRYLQKTDFTPFDKIFIERTSDIWEFGKQSFSSTSVSDLWKESEGQS